MGDEAQGTAVAVVEDGRQSTSFLAAILQAARDPGVDATKVETMANLAVKLQDRERETEFNRALNAAIQEMPIITKEGIITIPAKDGKPARTQGRFARFEDIYRVVRPILESHQLALRFNVDETQGGITVQPILSHANGYTERGGSMKLPPDTSGSKNNTQAVGSSVAYGKRYTMCAMLNIVTEGVDTDGSGAPVVQMPDERQAVVLADAKAAHEAGRYLEWFGSQGPKDRAWLISSGHHVEFGGQTALPPRTPTPAPVQEPAQQEQKPSKPKTNREKAEEWTAWFAGEVKAAENAAAIQHLQEENAETLGKLASFADLKRKADRAVDDALASL